MLFNLRNINIASVSTRFSFITFQCDICTGLILPNEDAVPMSCDHLFCRGCWSRYLTGKIQEGDAHNITCPGFDCGILVPVEVIETLVSRDMARRYLQFDIKVKCNLIRPKKYLLCYRKFSLIWDTF